MVEDDSITRRHSKKCTSNTLIWIVINTSTVNVSLHNGTIYNYLDDSYGTNWRSYKSS